MGYSVHSDIFNTANYGLAQTRNRIYIFATLRRLPRGFVFNEERVRMHFEGLHNTSLLNQKCTADILAEETPEKYFLSEKLKRTILANGSGGFVAKSEIDLPIARPLCATMAKMHRACQDNYFSEQFIASHGVDRYVGGVENAAAEQIRRLMPEEAFALQGFDPVFVENSRAQFGIADSNLYKQAGNAVSVNVFATALPDRFILLYFPYNSSTSFTMPLLTPSGTNFHLPTSSFLPVTSGSMLPFFRKYS